MDGTSQEVPIDRPLDLWLTLTPLKIGAADPSLRLRDGAAEWAMNTPEGGAALRITVGDGVVRGTGWGDGAPWALSRLADLSGASDEGELRTEVPLVRELVRRLPGLRLARTHRVTDAIVPVVLQQLVTWEEAAAAWARIVRAHGSPAPGPLDLTLPPTAETVAGLPRSHLIGAGALGRQADTIRRVCVLRRRMEEAGDMEQDDAARRLLAVPGVGPWTAGMVMLRSMGFADVVPLGDYHLPHTVSWALAREPRGTDARMIELLAPFAGHRGRVLRLMQAGGVGAPRRGPKAPLRRHF